jgi:hypothetical protein
MCLIRLMNARLRRSGKGTGGPDVKGFKAEKGADLQSWPWICRNVVNFKEPKKTSDIGKEARKPARST